MEKIRTYINSSIHRPVVRQFSWYAVGQLAVQIFSFLGVVITSRYLGPSSLGLYSFVQNYLGIFMMITTGMDFYFTWKIAKSEDTVRDLMEYLGHKMYVTLILSIIGILIGWKILPHDLAILVTIICLPLCLNSFTAFLQYAIISNKAKLVALTQFWAGMIIFACKVVLVYFKAPLIMFIGVSAGDTVLMVTILAFLFLQKKDFRCNLLQVRIPSILSTFKFMYSIRMSIVVIALWQLILRIDQLVLATFSNAYTLGIYAAAVKIAEVPNFFAGILYTSLITHVAVIATKEDFNSKRKVRKVMFIYLVLGFLISFAIIIFAPLLVKVLYGSKFTDAISVLRVYSLSIPAMFLSLHYVAVYGAKEKYLQQSLIFSIGIVLNIILIYSLTPLIGLTGASLATVISYSLVSFFFYIHTEYL